MILSLGAVGGKSITCGPVALMCGSGGVMAWLDTVLGLGWEMALLCGHDTLE